MTDWSQYASEFDRATYDPADDKLRVYSGRVSREAYDALKALGFGRAPKQGCFFQVWAPVREDAALGLCGEIKDEDSNIFDRAEERGVRFATYSDHAGERAEQAHERARVISERFADGQPILVGHHSERKARKDRDRADAAATKAVQEYRRADYWSYRARAAKRHAEYLFEVPVVLRRIKKLESDLRGRERDLTKAEKFLTAWEKCPVDLEAAKKIANYDDVYAKFSLDKYPRDHHTYEEGTSIWSALDYGIIGPEEAKRICCDCHLRTMAHSARWIDHLTGEIAYWKAVIEEKTGKDADEQFPLVKGCWIRNHSGWHQVKRVNKGANGQINSVSIDPPPDRWSWMRTVEYGLIKEWKTDAEYQAERPKAEPVIAVYTPPPPNLAKEAAQELAEQVKQAEIQVNYDPDYYPTPYDVVDRMMRLAPAPDQTCYALEPSAGDGRIALRMAATGYVVHCCETNYQALQILGQQGLTIAGSDFMEYDQETYHLIIMNPPFSRRQWIAHVKHAYDLLKPSGRLVSVVPYGYGDRQGDWAQAMFNGWLKDWSLDPLPDNSFEDTATKTAILVIDKEF